MNLLSMFWVKAAILAVIAAAVMAAFGWFVHVQRETGRNEIRAKWALSREAQKDAAIAEAASNARETLRRLTAQKDSQDANDKDMARARADAVAARSSADSLRKWAYGLASTGRSTPGHPALVVNGPTAGTAADVLADVLGRAAGAAGELAAHADAARAAGLQCQRSYDALSLKAP